MNLNRVRMELSAFETARDLMDTGVNVHQILLGETVKVTHCFSKTSFLYVKMCD